jgi:hypothetical protein
VLYGQETFHALEVKNTATIRPKTLNALRAFGQEYPEAETCLLYRGRERLRINDIFCLPVEYFLSRLHPDMPLSHALGKA